MKILDLIKENKTVEAIEKKVDGRFVVEDSLSLAFSLAASFKEHKRNILVVTPNLYQGQTLSEQIASLLSEDDILFYPFDEVIRINQTSSSKEMLSQRLYVMSKCLDNRPHILICHVSSFLRFLPSPELYKKNYLRLQINNHYSIEDIVNKLNELQFLRVNRVDQNLQFATRGDIIDIYPINSDYPYRLEFFDDELESIRMFDVATQTSFKTDLQQIEIFPSSEFLFEKDELDNLSTKVLQELEIECKNIPLDIKITLKKKTEKELNEIKEKGFDENLYPYFSYLNNSNYCIYDYFKPDTLVYYSYDKMQDAYDFINNEVSMYFSELFQNGLFISRVNYFKSLNYLEELNAVKTYSYENDNENNFSLKLRSIFYASNNILRSIELINEYINKNINVLIAMNEHDLNNYATYLKENEFKFSYLNDENFNKEKVLLCNYDFKEGFELEDYHLVILTKKELLGYRLFSSRYTNRYKKAEIISSYEDLKKGDYVVHEEHGIGQFEEITTLEFENQKKDYLKIIYQDNEVLYVPLESFYLIRKYVGKEGAIPHISKLGSSSWKKSKAKIKERMNNIAERLISLYAERERVQGFAFESDDEIQKSFENAFPYSLTEDQNRCVNEIKKDMESPYPMDRLLCGDVGFGKTEVAFRAAFKAILSHKQVALLCPTTILAKQHYEVALARFHSFGVKIALFSRFIPEKVQKEQIELIKEDKIDLIIGTHRLLSKEIVIPNLGLLIVDEEQRFGVEHKERIKEMANNIDVLTLSATPIPRTLQMSLIGIRKLSTINSAPMNRMPVQTYVMPYKEQLVNQVIERELARNGQVFYLHNRVDSIYQVARRIKLNIKNAEVGVVHGKMDKLDIDEIMNAYYENKINVLVCTSIIETGLDVPNANTMIIENADRFGLSQLYQIKGRVGRSNRVAYAYLLYNEHKELNEKADKRLQAIKEFTELGSGYKIAQRDLNIRGAGDILGSEQSGFIDSLGMDLYLKILSEVLKEKKGEQVEKKVKSIPLSYSGFIPNEYANNEDKIVLYQEIQNTNKLVSLELLKRKIRDIHGRIPHEVENLITKRKIDLLADSIYVESIVEGKVVIITLSKEFNNIPKAALKLNQELYPIKDYLYVGFKDKKFVIELTKDNKLLKNLEYILTAIIKIVGE